MNKTQFTIPQLALWLVRLIASPTVLDRIDSDSMLFASWYTMGADLIGWPEEARALQEAQRAKKLTMERALRLLEQLNKGQITTHANLKDARMLLEGYAMHEWMTRNWVEFSALVQDCSKCLGTAMEKQLSAVPNPLSVRVAEFSKVLQLLPVDAKVLTLAFTCEVFTPFRDLLMQLVKDRRSNVPHLWCAMLDCTQAELQQSFSRSGVLRTSHSISSSIEP